MPACSSAQVSLVGAEFTSVYAQRFGSRRHHAQPTAEHARIAPPIPERTPAGAPSVAVVVPHRAAPPGADAALALAHGPLVQPLPRKQGRSSMLAPAVAAAALGVAVLLLPRCVRWRNKRDS